MRRKLLLIAIVITCLITPLLWWQAGIPTFAQTLNHIFFPIIARDYQFNAGAFPPAETETTLPHQELRINGYPVPESIYTFYQKIGSTVAGKALTEYRLNVDLNRYEMYFDNLGIYILAGDPTQTVHLMPLGSWRLHAAMDTPAPSANIPISPRALSAMDLAASLAGKELTGDVLVPITFDDTGDPTRIFENVVMRVDNLDLETVRWLPLPKLLGIQPHPPTLATSDPRFYFLPVQGELGHNVPQDFLEFILNHGGLEISGNPITEIFYGNEAQTVIRQCFDHLCLDYDIITSKIQPTSLGLDYYRRFQNQQIPSVQAISALNMNVWEFRPALPAEQPQWITVRISQNGMPVINLKPLLEISLPNGETLAYNMPGTDIDGASTQQIPPVDAPNGSIIAYQVCILHMDASRYCVQDSYLIWNVP
jgi:hypothetical protein